MKKSEYWRNIFHPEKKFIVPRDKEGNWLEDFEPFSGFSFTEGNSWQYSFYVPQNIAGLIEAVGLDTFNRRLEEGFEKSIKHSFAAHAFDRSRSESIEYFVNHGNETNMQVAYLFNYSGKPYLTQKYTRMILDKFYGSKPYHGWEGDEDEGQMGGWFVISSMGLFEMTGGVEEKSNLNLTSPLFDKITIKLDPGVYRGNEFIIETINNRKENIYIQEVYLNDKPLNNTQIPFEQVVKGGKLKFIMGDKPGNWGIQN